MRRDVIDRLREPSSYAGIGLLLGALGINLDPGVFQSLTTIFAGVAGIASVLMGEPGTDYKRKRQRARRLKQKQKDAAAAMAAKRAP